MQPSFTQYPAGQPANSRTTVIGLMLLCWLLPVSTLLAQMGLNAPVGLKPKQDMEIYTRNSFLVQQKYRPTTDPVSGTYTMSCATSPAILTATAGVLLDPGGTSSYIASATCTQTVIDPTASSSVGYELTFDFLDTEANGDSVIIEDAYGGRIAFSGSTTPPVLLVPGYGFIVTLKADNDANVGAGFQLRWREVYLDPPSSGSGQLYFGTALQFDVTKGSLVGGLNGVGVAQKAGLFSTALGYNNVASGLYSGALGSDNKANGTAGIALGSSNTASGPSAIALGESNKASGSSAIALGYSNKATAFVAMALGNGNTASATNAIAIGSNAVASGTYSMALGNSVSTNSFAGAFIIGDNNAVTQTSSTFANQYTARFSGGYRLLTNSAATIGASLAGGGNAWATISDSTKKERFRPVDGLALLRNIGAMKLGTWNYIGQRDQRHYGPMAQEFFARFGHDELGPIGCDTLLNSHDFTAVTFTGVQALVHENESLKTQIAQLRAENEARRTENSQLRAEARRTESRLDAIEALLPARKRVINLVRK